MRQRLRYSRALTFAKRAGVEGVVHATVRGGEGHCVCLNIEDGRCVLYWPKTGRTKESKWGWFQEPTLLEKWNARKAREQEGA